MSQNPIGRVGATASGDGAEGATTPESLRQPDRSDEATLERSRREWPARPRGKPLAVKLSGNDDSGGEPISFIAAISPRLHSPNRRLDHGVIHS